MSGSTSINLGDHFTSFLGHLTESKRYGSASEAIRAGLRLLEQEEAKYAALMDALEEGETSGESDLPFDAIVARAKAAFHAK